MDMQDKNRDALPVRDGFFMPGEFEPHRGCILIWPFRPGSWNYGAGPAREAFRQVIWAIAQSEKVWVAAGAEGMASARKMLLGGERPGTAREGAGAHPNFSGADG